MKTRRCESILHPSVPGSALRGPAKEILPRPARTEETWTRITEYDSAARSGATAAPNAARRRQRVNRHDLKTKLQHGRHSPELQSPRRSKPARQRQNETDTKTLLNVQNAHRRGPASRLLRNVSRYATAWFRERLIKTMRMSKETVPSFGPLPLLDKG